MESPVETMKKMKQTVEVEQYTNTETETEVMIEVLVQGKMMTVVLVVPRYYSESQLPPQPFHMISWAESNEPSQIQHHIPYIPPHPTQNQEQSRFPSIHPSRH